MAKRTKKRKKADLNILSVILMLASILLGVLLYTQSGSIGKLLSSFTGGVIGWLKYLVPILLFLYSISVIKGKEEKSSKKTGIYIVLLLSLAVLMTVYQVSRGIMDTNGDFLNALERSYELGEKNIGGGVVGGILTIPLISLIGNLGTTILSIASIILSIVLILGIDVSEYFANLFEKMQENREIRKEEKIEEKEARKLKRAEEREKVEKEIQNNPEKIEEQITINLGKKSNENLKKYDHGKDDIVTLSAEKSETLKNDPLFKQKQEEKEEKIKEVLVLDHTEAVEDENYKFPSIKLLTVGKVLDNKSGKKEILDTAAKLQKTLISFGVKAKVTNVSKGPAVTRYEIQPAEGVRVNKIANLADDIALNLAAESIRIEAPIPGKQAVGIEIPNKDNEMVHLRDIIESEKFGKNPSKLAFALGKDVAGEEIIADIGKMPHVLIAGATGSGKSVCINTLITSIIYKAKPSEVKLVMIDPKIVELSVYNGIPHLLIPVVTDPKKAAGALAWAVQEMTNRYSKFADKNVRDIKGYNEVLKKEGGGILPQIVIIIDELADLMMVAANDVEDAICRLAQMARAAGMHLVIATQRPSVDVITGIIKANVPSRISFAVSSQVDSRTILDMGGAEKLLGKGDMLFFPSGVSKPTRIQGAFISDKEVESIVDFLKSNSTTGYNEDILDEIDKKGKSDKDIDEEDDDTDIFLADAIDTVVDMGQASTSFIQRRFKVGYARAGRIIDQMEERGIISGYEGSKPRKVLISKEELQELKMSATDPIESEDE